MQQQNSELEKLVKDALQDNVKLQESRESFRARSEKLDQELQVEHGRRGNAEHLADNLSKEKQWLQNSYDSLQRKAEELERAVESASQLADRNRAELQRIPELQRHFAEAESKCEIMEKEKQASIREVTKLKEILEAKDVTLDKRANDIECLEKDVSKLNKELEEAKTLVLRYKLKIVSYTCASQRTIYSSILLILTLQTTGSGEGRPRNCFKGSFRS